VSGKGEGERRRGRKSPSFFLLGKKKKE